MSEEPKRCETCGVVTVPASTEGAAARLAKLRASTANLPRVPDLSEVPPRFYVQSPDIPTPKSELDWTTHTIAASIEDAWAAAKPGDRVVKR